MFNLPEFLERKKRRVTVLLLTLSTCLVWVAVFQVPARRLEVFVFDVGEGDAIFIRTPENRKILIDGGPDETVLSRLGEVLPFWERTLDLVVVSHFDADHITGLLSVLKTYEVSHVLVADQPCTKGTCRELERLLDEERATRWEAREGRVVRLGKVRLWIYWPPRHCPMGGNNCSVVTLLDFNDFEGIFTGDLEEEGQQRLLAGSELNPVELFKVPHHGADCLWYPFLERLRPAVSVISVGENRYGHPTEATLGKLHRSGSRVLRTDLSGTIEIVSDGKGWSVVRGGR